MQEIEQAKTSFKSIRDLMRFAVSSFTQHNIAYGHGTTNPWDEAAYLVTKILHLPHEFFEQCLDAKLLSNEIKQIINAIRVRTEERLPVAYITHEAWLGNFPFYVDERVIVPRSLISDVINEIPTFLNPNQRIKRIADICTGSGCLAILMAHLFPNTDIDAVDISKDALEVARINIENYGLTNQINLFQGNMLSPLTHQYDLIICNPPYVNTKSMTALPPEYKKEPSIALQSGTDGLDHIRILFSKITQYLQENGLLLLEIGHNRTEFYKEWPKLEVTWLETTSGEGDVALITAQALKTNAHE
ncbi:MAG: 50S ribosomal protein L3 N(5)-glutamine methyltransferase [Proteobacteria bacterium]|nr:50S ribosomal protein L3 N(5)-glutamine methyltransferase [Pseudomonadota bacterium]MDE3208078.1 50S ribosomal protein L3 N(5)-glutamine methyltransferase [Pseudomonadota bacterium]